MSQENYRYRMHSNDLEGDDFFMPRDNVWENIDAVLHDKKDRKPFVFILFLVSLIILSFVFISPQIQTGWASMSTDKSATESPDDNTFQSSVSTIDEDDEKTIENTYLKPIEKIGIPSNNSSIPIKAKQGIPETSLAQNQTPSSSNVTQFEENITAKKNPELNKQVDSVNKSHSKGLTLLNQPDESDGQAPNYDNTLRNNQPFTNTSNQPIANTPNQPIVNTPNQPITNTQNQPITSSQSQPITNTPNQPITNTPNQPIAKTPNQPITNTPNQPTSETAEQLHMLTLPLTLVALAIDEDIDPKYWSDKFTLVNAIKPAQSRTWTFELLPYTSISTYSIQDFSGFNAIDFALTGDLSMGVQLMAKRQLTERIAIGFGLGIDNAHFNADYGIQINADELTVSELGTNYQAVISKNLPSLAGGLTTSFNLLSATQNLKTNEIQLNLAHNYRTIIVPLEFEYTLLHSHSVKFSVGSGLLFSKRLLTIDTGVNQLDGNSADELVELSSVSAVDLSEQPFRIYNAATSFKTGVDVKLSSAIHIGFQARIARPLFSIYQDQNYTVRSHQYQLGLSLQYQLGKD